MPAIGLDIIDITRIDKGIKRFGQKYIRRILGPVEQSLLESRLDRAQFVAGRFAAKEAIIKALGQFLKKRPTLQSLQVINDPTGQPEFSLPDEVKTVLEGYQVMVSISHEKQMAAAMVVILEEK